MSRHPHRCLDKARKGEELVFLTLQQSERKRQGDVSASHLFGEPRLSLLAAYEQHEPHAVSSHRRRYTLRLACEVVRPGQYDEERSAIAMEGSSSGDVLALIDVGDERRPEDQSEPAQKDHQKVLHRQSLPSCCKQEDQLSQKRAFQVGYVPGATDGSMPVGSVKTIYVIA